MTPPPAPATSPAPGTPRPPWPAPATAAFPDLPPGLPLGTGLADGQYQATRLHLPAGSTLSCTRTA